MLRMALGGFCAGCGLEEREEKKEKREKASMKRLRWTCLKRWVRPSTNPLESAGWNPRGFHHDSPNHRATTTHGWETDRPPSAQSASRYWTGCACSHGPDAMDSHMVSLTTTWPSAELDPSRGQQVSGD